jgi:hypothetical protein
MPLSKHRVAALLFLSKLFANKKRTHYQKQKTPDYLIDNQVFKFVARGGLEPPTLRL